MSEMWELPPNHQHAPDRRYTTSSGHPGAAEDLHAWSIYRQNLNSDFTDSALGTDERSPLPYGNFQLREQTVQSILRHPRLAPRSELGSNMYAYLKFGLPRVFPPNPKSHTGYDSNEEHHHQQQRSRSRMTDRGDHQQQAPRPMNGSGPNRARSETDLRAPDGLIQNRFKKAKPNGGSESNLLEQRLFKSGSQMSLVSRNSRPPINKGFQTPQSLEDNNGLETFFKHPHLQVRGLTYESTKRKGRILEGISFDLRGGELLAVMSTTALEGTALLSIVAGHRRSSDRISGEFLLNGNPVAVQRLSSRVAFVRRDYRLHPDITVEQTMKYHSMFKRSAKGHSEKRDQMKILLEELGLTAVRHCLVESLTSAERHRLSVACQLQLDTEILVLDQVTKGMDIFDTFFLVEYLRQWATRRARIVLLTIHPPTFEIFSMFTKVTLISTGRTMFYGHRREMLPYFAFIEYPCPGFKNPSDYYLDLVTLDDLSSEALLESSQRIETLADSYRRKQEPLSEPGPPVALPPKVTNTNIFGQIGGIWMYTLFYTFPWNIIHWLMLMLFAAGISICIGTIYWNVRLFSPQDQNSTNDRFGMQWTIMAMTPWPMLLVLLIRDHKSVQFVIRDTQDRLYSKAIYVIAKSLIELPFVVSIFLAYIIPLYVMAGLTEDSNNFYLFIGYQLLYLYSLRTLSISVLYSFSNRILVSTSLVAIISLILTLPAGYTIHSSDLGEWVKWIKFISPLAWILKPIIYGEMRNITGLSCPTNPVLLGAGQSNIMRKLECGLQNGPHALAQWDFADTYPIWLPILATVGFILIFKIAGFMGFLLRRHAPALPPPEKP